MVSTEAVSAREVQPYAAAFLIDRTDQRFSPVKPIGHTYILTAITATNGFELHFKGMKYPSHGFPFREAVQACDIVKRQTWALLNTARAWRWLAMGFVLLPWHRKLALVETVLDDYLSFAESVFNRVQFPDGLVGTICLKQEYLCPCARSVAVLVETFLRDLGFSQAISQRAGLTAATLLHYDNAYRYRLQDLFSETTNHALRSNPAGEVERLGGLLLERDQAVGWKFTSLISFARWAFKSYRVRQAWRRALFAIERDGFAGLQFDAADRYHVLLQKDYNYLGLTLPERLARWEALHPDGLPELVELG